MKNTLNVILILSLGLVLLFHDNAYAERPSLIIPAGLYLSSVNYVTTDSSGNIYATLGSGSVVKISPSGTLLLEFGSSGSANGQFSDPHGIALDHSGNIYVADTFNNRIEKFSSSGVYQSQIGCATGACTAGSGNGQFNNPYAIALDSSGNIYVTDRTNNRVEKFNSAGVYQSQIGCATGACTSGSGNGQFDGPVAIALDSSGNIYVVDTFNNRVQKFNSGGVYQSQFGSHGAGNGQFDEPWGIALDQSGNIYVADSSNNRVEKFNSAGIYQFFFGSIGSGNGQFSSPQGIALDQSGNIYVADTFNNRIEKFSSNGVFNFQIGCATGACSPSSSDGAFSSPWAITRDSSNNIYVADQGNNRIEKLDSNGGYLSQFGSFGSGNGQFSSPQGIALDQSGNIYVVDNGNNRVQKFNSAGVYQSQFGTSGTGNGQFDGPQGIALDSSNNIYVTDAGNHRVQKFNSAGVYQSQFGTSGTGNGQFLAPIGVTLDSSGNIYVTDGNSARVQKFNSAGTYQFTISVNGPTAITVDSSDNIYVVDAGNNRVEKFSSSGVFLSQFGSAGSGNGQFNSPRGIALDSTGDIYVADTGNNRIEKFVNYYTYLSQFGSSGSGNGQFDFPEGIALDPSGNIYVTDIGNHRVQKFNSAGTFQGWIGNCNSGTNCDVVNHVTTRFCSDCIITGTIGSGNGQFNFPAYIALDQSGNIYVVDSNNNRVEKFSSSGVYQSQIGCATGACTAGSANGQFDGPSGIALDQSGNMYVGDDRNNRVQKFSSSGVYQSQMGCATGACTAGSGNGQFDEPTGIALDQSGNIYVTDFGNNRVEKFNSAGVYQSQFGSFGSGNGQFNDGLEGIALDQSGNTYVIDYHYPYARVERFSPLGVYQFQFGTGGSGNGQFYEPLGVALDSSGNIWVSDALNNRVQKFPAIVECSPPVSGDWVIDSSCTLVSSATAPANVIVNNGAVLEIPNSVTLTINLDTNYLMVKSGGGVLIINGGMMK